MTFNETGSDSFKVVYSNVLTTVEHTPTWNVTVVKRLANLTGEFYATLTNGTVIPAPSSNDAATVRVFMLLFVIK